MSGRRHDKADPGGEHLEAQARRPRAHPAAKATFDSAPGLLGLQRSIGNQAVFRLVTGGVLQAKLQVGPAGDSYEREADQVAAEVMRNLAPSVTADEEQPRVRRSAEEAVVGLEGGPLAADTEAGIQQGRGGGTRLPDPLRRSMEGSFGADFGTVRVHTGPSAHGLNRALQSRAFTVGGDIFFARNQYQPQSRAGQSLLAHELTHTIQQGASGPAVSPGADTTQRLAVDSDRADDRDDAIT
jgi:hypothetical protein